MLLRQLRYRTESLDDTMIQYLVTWVSPDEVSRPTLSSNKIRKATLHLLTIKSAADYTLPSLVEGNPQAVAGDSRIYIKEAAY